jgi:hypothetical protein
MFRLIVIAVVCTMLLIPIVGFSSNIISSGPLLIAVSFGLAYFVIPVYLLRLWPSQKVKKLKSMSDALWDGELQTVEYKVCAIAQIEESEDEGLHFLIATESGQTLSLSGQYLYGPVERMVFPSEGVRLFKNSVSGQLYGVEPTGQRIQSWPIYDPFTVGRVQTDLTIEDGQFYPMSIEEIISKLGLRPAESSALAV